MACFWWHLMALMRAAILLVQLDDKIAACITVVQPGRSKTLVGATYNFCGVSSWDLRGLLTFSATTNIFMKVARLAKPLCSALKSNIVKPWCSLKTIQTKVHNLCLLTIDKLYKPTLTERKRSAWLLVKNINIYTDKNLVS